MKVFLKPGELYIGKGPAVISTILGSCVSVTMFNKRLSVGGICHALLPKENSSTKDTDKYRYVDSSISHMLKAFETMGIKKSEIEVKIFGGASIVDTAHKKSVGQVNVETALTLVRDNDLNIITYDFGGTLGRKIIFHTHTGRVLLKKLERIRNLS